MKVIMVMFDSLNRHMLPPYNADTQVHAPNFKRLAKRALTFDTSYVCSMPCMPARRDFHTGRPNFLHRGWGQLEPFDDSVPAMLSKAGVYTHLTSDHYHYWEDGGATYHGRYNSWEFFRGQEGDPFVGQVAEPPIPENINQKGRVSDWINRQHIRDDEDYPQTQTFASGVKFIDRNHDQDKWFLQIECFDPHEPFVSHRKYKDHYPSDYKGPLFDWPGYTGVVETPEQVEECRRNYAALVSKCDASLGDILDAMDRHDMWDDTMLILWTDHGFLLGEHQCWAKNWPPLYEEVAHTPFFIWDPRFKKTNERRSALVQPSIDLGPTLLSFFGVAQSPDMRGRDLTPAIENDTPVREAAIFGYHGNRINVTDGRHVYMREHNDDNAPLNQYTLTFANMRAFFGPNQMEQADLHEPLAFTKQMPVVRVPVVRPKLDRPWEQKNNPHAKRGRHLLFDLKNDPNQQAELQDEKVEQRMLEHMARLMREYDSPPEQFERMGIEQLAKA